MPMRDLEVYELANTFRRIARWRGLNSPEAESFASDRVLQLRLNGVHEGRNPSGFASDQAGTTDIASL